MISNYNWDSPTTSKSPPQKVSPSPSTPTPSPLQASINNLSAKLPPTSVNCALPNPIRPKVFATRVKPFAARPERQVSNVNCQYQRQRQKRCPPSPSRTCTQTDPGYRCTPTTRRQPFSTPHLCPSHRR